MIRYIKKLLERNKYTLNKTKADINQVTLEYWQEQVNLGDQLALVIFEWMLNQNRLSRKCSGIKHLMTVGSIIGLERFDATIWGTGVLNFEVARNISIFSKIVKYDIRAVRGPITREILRAAGYDVPPIYGDPGILMPLIYNSQSKKEYDVSIIHHFNSPIDQENDFHRIDIQTNDYKTFIDEIVKSKRVISSSLHGIILAETYGVPTIFYNENMDDVLLKYFDWYFSTQRTNVKIAHTLSEALIMEPMEIPKLDLMREQLLKSFPYDIFR